MPGPATRCPSCAASVRDDQRYCTECGDRLGAPRVDWRSRLALPPAVVPIEVPAAPVPSRLPNPRTAAALVLAMLGTGIVLGEAAVARSPDAVSPTTVVAMAPAPAVAPTPTSTPTPAPTAEPEPVEADPAPADDTAAVDEAAAEPASAAVEPAAEPAPEPTVEPEPEAEAEATPEAETASTFKHVWLVALRGVDVPDVAGDLADQGVTLSGYGPVGTGPVSGGLALLGGRAPTPESDAGCVAPEACLVPAAEPSLPGLLKAEGREWRAYLEAPTDPSCRPGGDPGDPAVWFRGLAEAADCAQYVVALSELEPALEDSELAPALSLVVPGVPAASVDPKAAATTFLQTWVPRLTASPAYADGGLVAIVSLDGEGALLLGGEGVVEPGATVKTSLDAYALTRTLADAFALQPPGLAADAEPLAEAVLGAAR